VTSQHEPEDVVLPLHEDGSDAERTALLESPETPETVEFQETVAEYEPGEDASASYRVDPSGPSEFRQGSSVEELEHTFTAVQSTGEMISEVPEAESAEQHPSAPIAHESAVQSVPMQEAQVSAVPFEAAQTFAPGAGRLEEELLDDEEGEIPAVHASAQDDTEEETLEHAADLGSMIRDMSIDELTRPEPVELDEEEDDFDIDEEDLEEDELNSSEAEEGVVADGEMAVAAVATVNAVEIGAPIARPASALAEPAVRVRTSVAADVIRCRQATSPQSVIC
jgi:ribonuclease G